MGSKLRTFVVLSILIVRHNTECVEKLVIHLLPCNLQQGFTGMLCTR